MTTLTIVFLLAALIVAAGLSFFQYFFKAGTRSNVTFVLALLRFLSIFGILLLLINPVITRKSYQTEKTPLVIALDNSVSITELGAAETSKEIYRKLSTNAALTEKFDLRPNTFASEVEPGA